MNKKAMGLLGTVSAVAMLGGVETASAGPASSGRALQPAQSYSELLDPIPNAVEILRADDQEAPPHSQADDLREMAQYEYPYHRHHYHHHHHYYHHHHHHHHYHHHHHHRHYYY